jgi:hypothetical protein
MAMISYPTNLYPDFTAVQYNSNLNFSWTPQGDTQASFYFYLYNQTNLSTPVYSLYSGTSNNFLTLTPAMYAMSLGGNYVWKVVLTGTLGGSVTSYYATYKADMTPNTVVVASPTVTSESYTFSATYYLAGTAPIKSFIWTLYDSTGTIQLDSSGYIYSPTVKYTFTGMQTGVGYIVSVTVTSALNLSGTGTASFTVNFINNNSVGFIEVTPNDDKGYNRIKWSSINPIYGTINPTYYKFIE